MRAALCVQWGQGQWHTLPGVLDYHSKGMEMNRKDKLFCNKIKNLPVNNNHSVPSPYHLHSVKGFKTGLWTLDDVRMTFHMQLYMHVVQP